MRHRTLAAWLALLAGCATTTPEPDARAAIDDRAAFAAYRAGDLGRAGAEASRVIEAWLAEPALDADGETALGRMADLADDCGRPKDAVRAWQRVLAARETRLDPADPALIRTRQEIAVSLYRSNRLAEARALAERSVAEWEARAEEDDLDLARARFELGVVLGRQGESAAALPILEKALAARERRLPAGHPDVSDARVSLGNALFDLGQLEACRVHMERAMTDMESALGPAHVNVIRVRMNLANILAAVGDFEGASVLEKQALADLESRNIPDDPDLINLRENHAHTLRDLGDLPGARKLMEQVLADRRRTLPADDPLIPRSQINLAAVLSLAGDRAGARVLEEEAVESFRKRFPPDHPELLHARHNLATTWNELGEHEAAARTYEEISAAAAATFEPDHPDLALFLESLAIARLEEARLEEARALLERVLAIRERVFPEGSPEIARARMNLGVACENLGDTDAAFALVADAVEIYRKTYPADHPESLRAQLNQVSMYSRNDRLAESNAILEGVLRTAEETLPPDHYERLGAEALLAANLAKTGDLDGARARYQAWLAGPLPARSPDDERVLGVRAHLAGVARALGDDALAREQAELLLASRRARHPPDHPDLLFATGLALVLARDQGRKEEARALLAALVDGTEQRARALLSCSPREARLAAGPELERLGLLLGSDDPDDARTEEELARILGLAETLRYAVAAPPIPVADDPESVRLQAEARRLRRELDGRATTLEPGAEPAGALARATLERDRAERELRARLRDRGQVAPSMDAGSIAKALMAGEAAVGIVSAGRPPDPDDRSFDDTTDRALLAFVVRPEGGVRVLPLGGEDEVGALVDSWRGSIGVGTDASRGIGTAASPRDDLGETALGERLRAQVLDPILAASGGATTLYVCLDGPLHALPLDALPLSEGIVGDRARIVVQTSFAGLVAPRARGKGQRKLLALGGVRYGPTASPGAGVDFEELPATLGEVEELGRLCATAGAADPEVLSGDEATKEALFARAPQATHLHVATHGWSSEAADGSASARSRSTGTSAAFLGTADALRSLAPMTLCGLALAGANAGRDALGNAPGRITAEELCTLDLARCELAVLSACETNVGVRRAGEGVQSLQAAVHAAGARSAVTSLWKVPDEATRVLMSDFYRRMWIEGKPKGQALWEAKSALREARGEDGRPRYATRDWAAWVLTGSPD